MTPGDRVRVTTTVTVDGLVNADGTAREPVVILPEWKLTAWAFRPGLVMLTPMGQTVWIPSRLVEKCG